MRLTNIGTRIKHFISLIGSIGYAPGDSAELKSLKSILTLGLIPAILNLVYFSNEYNKIGRYSAAVLLQIFAMVLTLNIIFFRVHRNFKVFRNTGFIGFYIYMVTYHCLMGGYIGSVVYINYAIPILVGVQMFYKKSSHKNAWYFTYILTAIILYLLEPVISRGMVPISDYLILLTHVNNFILISSLVMLSVNYFVKIVQQEKLKSDILIRNILPEPVVSELNLYGIHSPVMFPVATAIFLDFVGFTRITQEMEPQEMVSILNEHFTSFDKIFREYKVEKLKTIGDGYMAVGGVPEANNSHPVDVALAGMKILKYMENNNKGKDVDWNLRIGIHTGPMVAGIIGETKFSYDVWGRSVNLCSRLETASKPGFINVSHEFVEFTNEFFEFEPRGLVEIKNSVPTRMYFLKDIKEHLRSEHFLPNSSFYELYEQYARTPF